MDFYPGAYKALAKENARLKRELTRVKKQLNEALARLKELQHKADDPARFLDGGVGERAGSSSPWRRKLRYNYDAIIGESPAIREVLETLDRVVDSDLPVLIQGESGTGKELVARAIHYNSPRRNKPFVAENCGAIPDSLLESEFFGHVKGSFSGATSDKKGLFEIADGGTLFLDEISNMSREMQKKLLRVLETNEIRKVGSTEIVRVDVRIISASNTDLSALVEKGRFRQDLFFRINTIVVEMPPLRKRKEDIPILVDHFVEKAARKMMRPAKRVSPKVIEIFMDYDWPGNVRELENEVYRLVALSGTEEEISADLVSAHIVSGGRVPEKPFVPEKIDETTLRKAVARAEREVIVQALERTGGNRSKAARLLGLSPAGLIKKMEALGLTVITKVKQREQKS
ncbi:MAG: DNA-binding response regulator [Planctomycetota bacterium]|nr:MAG: DNA-binding response regulator [Planctomycetota bacterium]